MRNKTLAKVNIDPVHPAPIEIGLTPPNEGRWGVTGEFMNSKLGQVASGCRAGEFGTPVATQRTSP